MPDAPTLFARFDLPEPEGLAAIIGEVAALWRDTGVQQVRATIVNAAYPKNGYADGIYFEGWLAIPKEEPPFSYPLTEA